MSTRSATIIRQTTYWGEQAETESAKQTMLANLRREYDAKLRLAGDAE